jgi:hypothetical protein
MASPLLVLKAFDTAPPWTFTLADTNGPINLTTATSVMLAGKGVNTGSILGPVACTIVNPISGQISYTPTTTDTGTADVFNIEISIHWTAGGVQKVPNAAGANPQIQIDPDLAGASE